MLKRRVFLSMLMVYFLVGSILISTIQVSADEIWDNMSLATKNEQEGNYDVAVTHWLKLVDLYEQNPSKMNWINYAMYLDKIGNYYAGEYSATSKNRPLAVDYYDRSHEAYKNTDLTWAVVQTKNKADKLRTTIRLFIQQPAEENKKNLAKFEPSQGAYIGMYAEFDSRVIDGGYVSPSKMESTFNKNHAIILGYATWGKSNFPSILAENVAKHGGSLQIAMEPIGGLDEVKDNDYIRRWAKDANKSGVPIFLRFGGEMNGEWVPWGLDPDKYIETFRLIHNIMEEEAPNVAMLWSPNDIPYYNMEEYYPGDKYVDWVGVSSYAVPDGNGHSDLSNYNMNQLNKLQHIYALYGDKKPIMISEGAVAYYAKTFADKDFNNWYENNMHRLYDYLPMLYPNIKAITYFNRKEDFNNYSLEDNSKANKVYNEVISSEYYLSKIGDISEVSYVEVGLKDVEKSNLTFSTYASIYDPFISKVEYYLNGILINTTKDIPYDMNYDFSDYEDYTANIRVKVYDSNGEIAGDKTFSVNFVKDYEEIIVKIGDPNFYANGQKKEIDPGRGTKPVIINNRTLIPIRALIESMGGNIEWDGLEKKVTIIYKDKVIDLWLGKLTAIVNGVEVITDTAPDIINGRTYLPIRFIVDNLGLNIDWKEETKEVIIKY